MKEIKKTVTKAKSSILKGVTQTEIVILITVLDLVKINMNIFCRLNLYSAVKMDCILFLKAI